MAGRFAGWSRRSFLHGAGLASLVASVSPQRLVAARAERAATRGVQRTRRELYAELGVRPTINAAGPHTAIGGSLMPPEVVAAMDEASRAYVSIAELQAAVGKRIAAIVGSEAALVTGGCAAAIAQGTAACVCGSDAAKILRAPDLTGMKNEVVIQKSHRFPYEHAIRAIGVTLVEVESRDELRAAINEKTAMLFFLNWGAPHGQIQQEEWVRIGKAAGIPTMIDVAADLPPADNLTRFVKMGFDMTVISGGKTLRGPQCSGLLLGRRDLIDAAFLNGPPHSETIARHAKVGKEEIVGVLTALELYVKKDHDAEYREWDRQATLISHAIADVPGVSTTRVVPEVANHVPYIVVQWDQKASGFTGEAFYNALRDGTPRIEVRYHQPDKDGRHIGHCPVVGPHPEISTWFLEPGEYKVVAKRCVEVLTANVKRT